MTVKELKVLLEKFDENAEIVFQDPDAVMTVHAIVSVGTVPTTSGKTVCINAEYFK
jgi:hypothetical protein